MDQQDKIIRRFQNAQDKLVLQASDLSLETIANMVEKGSIDLEPLYQRRQRWEPEVQSALIESFLLNIPIPPIYFAEDDYGTYSVIDGKQRITAIWEFVRNDLKLRSLETFVELEGLTFEKLPRPLKNALEVRPYLRVITLLKQSDPGLKYEVFTRLNKLGVPLNPQEIRNVAFRGPLNDMVYKLAENDFLRRSLKVRTDSSTAYRQMTDAEYVLRFFTMLETWESFSGDYRRSMDDFMKRHQNETENYIENAKNTFNECISLCEQVWGDDAFKRSSNGIWRNQTMASVYDAEMIAVNMLTDNEKSAAVDNKESIIENTMSLMEDPKFDKSIRTSTNTPGRVKHRIMSVHQMLLNSIN